MWNNPWIPAVTRNPPKLGTLFKGLSTEGRQVRRAVSSEEPDQGCASSNAIGRVVKRGIGLAPPGGRRGDLIRDGRIPFVVHSDPPLSGIHPSGRPRDSGSVFVGPRGVADLFAWVRSTLPEAG